MIKKTFFVFKKSSKSVVKLKNFGKLNKIIEETTNQVKQVISGNRENSDLIESLKNLETQLTVLDSEINHQKTKKFEKRNFLTQSSLNILFTFL